MKMKNVNFNEVEGFKEILKDNPKNYINYANSFL